MPLNKKVYNVTFETFEVQIYSQPFKFLPRSFTDVQEPFISALVNEHSQKGLIVINDGDDFEKKKIEALTNYLGLLKMRLQNLQMYFDERRRHGATPEEFVNIQSQKNRKWHDEICKILGKDMAVPVDQSFLTVDDVQKEASFEDEKIDLPKRRGRPPLMKEVEASV